MSIHYYVTTEMNLKKDDVPHYTGSIQLCVFPMSETYCYQVILAYKPCSTSNPLSNKRGKSYCDHFLSFMASYSCPKSILLAYERAKRRKLQEDKGIFTHEPASNVDYNQDMDMEFEGMEQDEAEAIKMMALHGSGVPDDNWDLPRGLDYEWPKPRFQRRAQKC
jgi:hypothetical protein